MLMEYGCEHVGADWQVDEKAACGFVRLYDVYGGRVLCHEADATRAVAPGSVYLFPSASPYWLEQDLNDRLFCTYLHLDIAPYVLRRMTVMPAPPGSFARALFDAVRSAVVAGQARMIHILAQAVETCCEDQGLFSRVDGPVAQTLGVMAADLRKSWTIEELSACAGYSESYFVRRFRAEVGVPPHQYLIKRRMKEALRLLWEGMSVTQVAADVGYPELKAFSRAFKQWYGVAPTDFRKSGRRLP